MDFEKSFLKGLLTLSPTMHILKEDVMLRDEVWRLLLAKPRKNCDADGTLKRYLEIDYSGMDSLFEYKV